MKSVRIRMSDEAAHKYIDQLQDAGPGVIRLARHLQKMAFHGEKKVFSDDCVPAPLYLRLATVLANDREMGEEFSRLWVRSGMKE